MFSNWHNCGENGETRACYILRWIFCTILLRHLWGESSKRERNLTTKELCLHTLLLFDVSRWQCVKHDSGSIFKYLLFKLWSMKTLEAPNCVWKTNNIVLEAKSSAFLLYQFEWIRFLFLSPGCKETQTILFNFFWKPFCSIPISKRNSSYQVNGGVIVNRFGRTAGIWCTQLFCWSRKEFLFSITLSHICSLMLLFLRIRKLAVMKSELVSQISSTCISGRQKSMFANPLLH